jgi:peroxiredoxin
MRVSSLMATALLICSLRAQSKLETLAAKVQADAAREEVGLGLDTRIRAAERLRLVDPVTAKRILDDGLPILSKPLGPKYLALRFMVSYAFVDLDAAERAANKIADKAEVYTALIQRSTEVAEYARVNRSVGRAVADGQYSLAVIPFALQKMKPEVPVEAAKLLLRLVAAFPTSRATHTEVRALLRNLAVFPELDAPLGREAIHKIFEAIDRPDFRKTDSDREMTATYIVRGKEILTETSYETVLLPSAAYLAVFDPEAFQVREASLPEWRSILPGLRPFDLPNIMRANLVYRHKPIAPQTAAAANSSVQPTDYSKMDYQEALAAARQQDPSHHCWILGILVKRQDLVAERRRQAFEEIWMVAREMPLWDRYSLMRHAFAEAVQSRIDGVFGPAVRAWIETLDAAAKSNDRMLLIAQENGELHEAFRELGELLEERDYALPQPHPSIVARRDLRSLDRAAYERVDFTATSLDGKSLHLADLKGKVVMIDFWATWCPPCRDALPALDKIHQDWRDKGLVVLGISDESSYVIKSFLSKFPITYPTLLDPDRKIHNQFGQDGNGQGIPLTVVFDREGNFVDRVPYPHNEQNFLSVLEKAGLR